jgi:DNA-binding CsgD family transcriptional regulator/PAS domain-containing protein
MQLPRAGWDHLLCVTVHPQDLVALYGSVLGFVGRDAGFLIALTGEETAGPIRSLLELSGLPAGRRTVEIVASPSWETYTGTAERLLSSVHERAGDRPIVIVADMDVAFRACAASSEIMSLVFRLQGISQTPSYRIIAHVSPGSLPKGLPAEFFEVHSGWVFPDTPQGAAPLDRTAQEIALQAVETRQRFLATARDGGALDFLPSPLADIRGGILLLDRSYVIRFCSKRAAAVLGRDEEDLLNRSVTSCLDGVDLVTLRHECEKLGPGRNAEGPFIASWRISPGVYEPREVRIDPLRSNSATIGFILTVSYVEPVRGPRAVYDQLKAEKASEEPLSREQGMHDLLSEDEAVSGDLHGTQITRREHEVILLILRGMSNREISNHLSIAEVTVKKHLTSVYRKLRITSRRELLTSFSRPGRPS